MKQNTSILRPTEWSTLKVWNVTVFEDGEDIHF